MTGAEFSNQFSGPSQESRLLLYLCTAELLHPLPPTLLEVVKAREAGILPVLCREGEGGGEEGGGQEQQPQVLHRDGYLVRTGAGAGAGALRQQPGGSGATMEGRNTARSLVATCCNRA